MELPQPNTLGLCCTAAALLTGLTLAGCGQQISGTATVDNASVEAYKTEIAASSAAATSSQRAAARTKAISDNCTQFPGTTSVGVTTFNAFVDAHDANAPDYTAKRDTAVQTLQNAATTVETRVRAAGGDLPPDLASKFTDYVTAARALADITRTMAYTTPVGPLNDASRKVNDSRNAVRAACPTR